MLIQIVMLIFIFVLLLTAWYMWHRRNGQFLIYDIGASPRRAAILKWTAIVLILESVLGLIILFTASKYFNLITVVLASLTILIFGLLINQKHE